MNPRGSVCMPFSFWNWQRTSLSKLFIHRDVEAVGQWLTVGLLFLGSGQIIESLALPSWKNFSTFSLYILFHSFIQLVLNEFRLSPVFGVKCHFLFVVNDFQGFCVSGLVVRQHLGRLWSSPWVSTFCSTVNSSLVSHMHYCPILSLVS